MGFFYCFSYGLQVFAVRSGGATGVVVKGPDEKSTVTFRFVLTYEVYILHNSRMMNMITFLGVGHESYVGKKVIHSRLSVFDLHNSLSHHQIFSF